MTQITQTPHGSNIHVWREGDRIRLGEISESGVYETDLDPQAARILGRALIQYGSEPADDYGPPDWLAWGMVAGIAVLALVAAVVLR